MSTTRSNKDVTGRIGVVGYEVNVNIHEVIRIKAELVMYIYGGSDAKIIAEAQRKLALFFCSGDIDIVKASDKLRCFYCASLNEDDAVVCRGCGASL